MQIVEGLSLVTTNYARLNLGSQEHVDDVRLAVNTTMAAIEKAQKAIIGSGDTNKFKRLQTLFRSMTELNLFYLDQTKIMDFKGKNPDFDMTTVIEEDYLLNYIPRWPMFVNLLSACLCLGLSATFHQLQYLSKPLTDKLATLDYGGITILIMGSTYPPIFYPFACNPLHGMRNVFLIFSTVSNVGFFLCLLNDRYAGSGGRSFRATGFVVLGLSAVAPLAYLYFNKDLANQSFFAILPYWWGGQVYIGGAIIYAARIPERCRRRTFDIVGSSHQIFHICVIIGAWIHFKSGLELYQERTQKICPIVLPTDV
jgi:channel protein (hemolysin III family)